MNREKGKKEEEGERMLVGMAKVFDFQMPVIYVMFKFNYSSHKNSDSKRFCIDFTPTKLWKHKFSQDQKICQSFKYLTNETLYTSNNVYGN